MQMGVFRLAAAHFAAHGTTKLMFINVPLEYKVIECACILLPYLSEDFLNLD